MGVELWEGHERLSVGGLSIILTSLNLFFWLKMSFLSSSNQTSFELGLDVTKWCTFFGVPTTKPTTKAKDHLRSCNSSNMV